MAEHHQAAAAILSLFQLIKTQHHTAETMQQFFNMSPFEIQGGGQEMAVMAG